MVESGLQLASSIPATLQAFVQNQDQKDLFLCSYTARLVAHPHCESYSVVFCPNIHHRYKTNHRTSQPMGICFQQLTESICVNFLCTILHEQVSVLPWHLPQPTLDMCLFEHEKRRTPFPLYRHYFTEMTFAHAIYTAIYIDESLVKGLTGWAFFSDELVSTFQLAITAASS